MSNKLLSQQTWDKLKTWMDQPVGQNKADPLSATQTRLSTFVQMIDGSHGYPLTYNTISGQWEPSQVPVTVIDANNQGLTAGKTVSVIQVGPAIFATVSSASDVTLLKLFQGDIYNVYTVGGIPADGQLYSIQIYGGSAVTYTALSTDTNHDIAVALATAAAASSDPGFLAYAAWFADGNCVISGEFTASQLAFNYVDNFPTSSPQYNIICTASGTGTLQVLLNVLYANEASISPQDNMKWTLGGASMTGNVDDFDDATFVWYADANQNFPTVDSREGVYEDDRGALNFRLCKRVGYTQQATPMAVYMEAKTFPAISSTGTFEAYEFSTSGTHDYSSDGIKLYLPVRGVYRVDVHANWSLFNGSSSSTVYTAAISVSPVFSTGDVALVNPYVGTFGTVVGLTNTWTIGSSQTNGTYYVYANNEKQWLSLQGAATFSNSALFGYLSNWSMTVTQVSQETTWPTTATGNFS